MANESRSRFHHHDDHNWDSAEYVSDWAAGQERKETARQAAFRAMADIIPYDKAQAIRILDLGAGYGALTQFLLSHFPNATAVCQDGSREMAALGHERMKTFAGRFEYAFCDFRRRGWSSTVIKAGDSITIEGYPTRDGSFGMRIQRVIFADGRELLGQGRVMVGPPGSD